MFFFKWEFAYNIHIKTTASLTWLSMGIFCSFHAKILIYKSLGAFKNKEYQTNKRKYVTKFKNNRNKLVYFNCWSLFLFYILWMTFQLYFEIYYQEIQLIVKFLTNLKTICIKVNRVNGCKFDKNYPKQFNKNIFRVY